MAPLGSQLNSAARSLTVFASILTCALFCVLPVTTSAGENDKVLIIPLKDQIDKAHLYFLRRGFQLAQDTAGITAVVIDMDTPGGELKSTEEIVSWMRSLADSGIKIYTFVNPRAQSAGAIIGLASEKIFMAPGSRIGSAAPILMGPAGGVQEVPDDVKEKILSDTRALVRGLAQENGYLPELAAAFVDASVEVKVGDRVISAEGDLLNLTAMEAVEIIPPMETPILAQSIVKDIAELMESQGLSGAEVIRIEPLGSERFARWITMLAPLLMAAAFIGIYTEIKTPGFGVPGLIGVASLALFLFGHYIAGLAGKVDILLVLIGIILIIAEVFIIPGFGIFGILGLVAFFGGVLLAMVPHLPSVPTFPEGTMPTLNLQPFLHEAFVNFTITAVITVVTCYFLSKFLPTTGIYRELILAGSTSTADGYIATNVEKNMKLLGRSGIAITPLRPAGIATIDDARVDVVSLGDYIDEGEKIIVREVKGPRVAVDIDTTEDDSPEMT